MGSGPSATRSPGLNPRFLLDTHVLIRWLSAPKRLSRDQRRILADAVRRREAIAVSAITLLEIAILADKRSGPHQAPLDQLFSELESHPLLRIEPLTVAIASEVAALGPSLRDPADRAIVATARVRNLRLLTSDQRIIESNLVPVVA
jgi:PIN domain nuclease of toxin-antitoxin system